MRSESGSKTSRGDVNRRSNRESCYSDASTASGESSSSITRKSSRLKFIKNVRPESLKRPSSYINVDDQVAVDKPDCTLVGYRKLDRINAVPIPPVELGTLNVSVISEPPLSGYGVTHPFLYSAMSLPTLVGQSHPPVNCSGSLPDLALNSSPLQAPRWSKLDKASKVPSDSSCSSSPEIKVSFNTDELADTTVNCCGVGEETPKVDSDDSTPKALTALPGNSSLVEVSDAGSMDGISRGVSECVVSGKEGEGLVSASGCDAGEGTVSKGLACLEASKDLTDGEGYSKGASLSNHMLVMEQNSGHYQLNQDGAERRENLSTAQRNAEKAPNELDKNNFPDNDRSDAGQMSADNDCDVDGVSGHCTVLELIKEEYERSQTEGGTSSSASSLSDLNMTTKGSKELAKDEFEENGACASGSKSLKPYLKNGLESALVSANSGSSFEKPQRLVDEVTDKIVRFISAKETLRKQLDLRELFYRYGVWQTLQNLDRV